MRFNKNLIILSLLRIFCISLGTVSAADNADMGVNDINDNDVATVESSLNVDDEISAVSGGEIPNSSEIANEISKASGLYEIKSDYQINQILEIHNDLDIMGNGHTIYGNGNQAFRISGGGSVNIHDLNFVNCSSNMGGAILCIAKDLSLTVKSCSFTDCSASGFGGAIACRFSGELLTVEWCSFINCSANSGSAIYYASNRSGSVDFCVFDCLQSRHVISSESSDLIVRNNNFFAINDTNLFPGMLVDGTNSPKKWLVLNSYTWGDEYVLDYIYNDGSTFRSQLPSYRVLLEGKIITLRFNNFSCKYEPGSYYEVRSPNSYNLLTSLKGVNIVLSDKTVFEDSAGEEYIISIKSKGKSIGAGYTVVLELVNGDIRKNYTLVTNDEGNVSLPINLVYAKNYTFNIYFNHKGVYVDKFTSQNITVKGIKTVLITDYTDDKMNSTRYSGANWTANFTDSKGNPIANTYVGIHFKKAGAESDKVYKVKSDGDGIVKLQLNLGYAGEYIIFAKFVGSSKYASSESKNITITIISRDEKLEDVKLVTNYVDDTLVTIPNSCDKFKVQLLTVNDKAIECAKVKINFTNSKGVGNVYTVTTDSDGFAYLTLNLSYIGNYTATVFFEGNANYNPSQDKSITSVKVEK